LIISITNLSDAIVKNTNLTQVGFKKRKQPDSEK